MLAPRAMDCSSTVICVTLLVAWARKAVAAGP